MSQRLDYEKWIYDNVHGYIGVTSLEREIIDTRIFQRLRRVKHLGLANYVYPGATHTRFAHSLGALFVMHKMCETLIPTEKVREEDLQLLRLSALLHDIGHYPFSHVIERLVSKTDSRGKHANLGITLIKKTKIGEILSRNGVAPNEIEKILLKKKAPEYPVYSYLLDSDLDVDKIDYLLRDSVHTGVAYGSIDVDRLIRTTTVDDEGTLAVREKGKQAVENLMIARYHMYQTVYFHKAVSAFELMIRKVYEELLKEDKVFDLEEIVKRSEEQEGLGLCNFDDCHILQTMKSYDGSNHLLKELIDMILCRVPLSKVSEDSAFTVEKSRPSYLSLLDINSQKQNCAKEAGIDKEWIFLNHIPPIQFSDSPIKVEKEGNFIPMDEDETSIAYVIAKHAYTSYRVYTKEEFKDNVKQAIWKCFRI